MTQVKKYDIIFLDHRMPNKDGVETLNEMRSANGNLNMKLLSSALQQTLCQVQDKAT